MKPCEQLSISYQQRNDREQRIGVRGQDKIFRIRFSNLQLHSPTSTLVNVANVEMLPKPMPIPNCLTQSSPSARSCVFGSLCELSVLKRETNNSVPHKILKSPIPLSNSNSNSSLQFHSPTPTHLSNSNTQPIPLLLRINPERFRRDRDSRKPGNILA